MSWVIEVLDIDNQVVRRIWINNHYNASINDNNTIVIGRDSTNDISFSDKSVSRRHAQIEIRNNTLYLKDLNSKFKTCLKRHEINEVNIIPYEEHQIFTNDIIRFGATPGYPSRIRCIKYNWLFCVSSRLVKESKLNVNQCMTLLKARSTNNAANCHYIVTEQYSATLKNIIGIAMRKPFVTSSWLDFARSTAKIVDIPDPTLYVVFNIATYFIFD